MMIFQGISMALSHDPQVTVIVSIVSHDLDYLDDLWIPLWLRKPPNSEVSCYMLLLKSSNNGTAPNDEQPEGFNKIRGLHGWLSGGSCTSSCTDTWDDWWDCNYLRQKFVNEETSEVLRPPTPWVCPKGGHSNDQSYWTYPRLIPGEPWKIRLDWFIQGLMLANWELCRSIVGKPIKTN